MTRTARFTTNTLTAPSTVDLCFVRYPGASGSNEQQGIGSVPVTVQVDGRDYHLESSTLGPRGKVTVPVAPHSVTTVRLLYTTYEVRPHASVNEAMVDGEEPNEVLTRLVRLGYVDEATTSQSWSFDVGVSNFQADANFDTCGPDNFTDAMSDHLRNTTGGH